MKKQQRQKIKKVVPYNKRERNAKILNFTLQIAELNLSFLLTPEIKQKFNDFATNGTTYIDTIDIPKLSRQMEISLINDKNQKTFINFKYITQKDEIE